MNLKQLIHMHLYGTIDISYPQGEPEDSGMVQKLRKLGRVRIKGKLLNRIDGISQVQTKFNKMELSAITVAKYGR